jgi:hypothetical protein
MVKMTEEVKEFNQRAYIMVVLLIVQSNTTDSIHIQAEYSQTGNQ